jgi:hypothetical protein
MCTPSDYASPLLSELTKQYNILRKKLQEKKLLEKQDGDDTIALDEVFSFHSFRHKLSSC